MVDGLDTTWEVVAVRMANNGPTMTLLRDGEFMYAGPADIRHPGQLLGF